jgi:hypothetical protein
MLQLIFYYVISIIVFCNLAAVIYETLCPHSMTTSTALSCTFKWITENKRMEMEISHINNNKEPIVFGCGVVWIGLVSSYWIPTTEIFMMNH